jgi:hypothetical protein
MCDKDINFLLKKNFLQLFFFNNMKKLLFCRTIYQLNFTQSTSK